MLNLATEYFVSRIFCEQEFQSSTNCKRVPSSGSLVGFVKGNPTSQPSTEVGLSGAGMLGRTGRCKSFDNSANGYARGEAVVACVFKKGQGAEDVENRQASFVSGFVNQDGRSASLTVSWRCRGRCRAFGSRRIESPCYK